MADDKEIARRLVDDEITANVVGLKARGMGITVIGPHDLPAEVGPTDLITFIIGVRYDLSKTAVRRYGDHWRKVIGQYPNGMFYLNLMGYDEDPREIWDIVEAARYVRRWAKAAGIHSPADITVELAPYGLGFLSLCGVFGDALKETALSEHRKKYGAPVSRN